MLNLKKEAEPQASSELKVFNCQICLSYVCHVYFMKDAKTGKSSKWGSCKCGIIFNLEKPTKVYDLAYWQERSKYDKKLDVSYSYPILIYAPIIEELIYGRRVLIVGRPNTYQESALALRGWVPTIIDKNTCFETKGNVIASDFETHKFPDLSYEDSEGKLIKMPNFNMIWLYHTLECFHDPVAVLVLCKKLLSEDGILFIATPDTDFIHTRSSSCFIHWKADENHIMWNKASLCKQMESLGFNTILCRSNYEQRFPIWDDIHGIFQLRFF